SHVQERRIFESILDDLRRPDIASGRDARLEYELVPLSHEPSDLFDLDPSQFIIEAEQHGVPQARHRVIICGVRSDIRRRINRIPRLRTSRAPAVRDVISDLPLVRSALSYRGNGADWLDTFDSKVLGRAMTTLKSSDGRMGAQVARRMASSLV